MAKAQHCNHCGCDQLNKLGVPGIRQCARCKQLVDIRSSNWLKRFIDGLAA